MYICEHNSSYSSIPLYARQESEYGEKYKISIDQYDADEGMLVLHVDKTVRPNFKYILQIEYNGDIQQMPYGLFKISTNMTETGEIKYVSFIRPHILNRGDT